ncbi:ATP-binding protein [Cereibacter johrii]|uniref:sensor histidine kinase n=1 Tax=Cereibacter johrii TaxID=445629 RepID=UPI002B257444|nr:ATP-binding protein [Cereibacter johrii]MEA5160602.1 ATP-binding protein [Cereibacter johrii]
MSSIQRRLFLVLLAATGAIWLSAALWVHSSTRTELNRMLDNRLAEAARMVGSLVDGDGLPLDTAMQMAAPALPGDAAHGYAHQLSCQVWGLDGTRIAASSQAPAEALSTVPQGFSEHAAEGIVWRVYTHVDEARGIRVMVGDSLRMRERLLHDMVLGLMWPALVVLPLLACAIWLSLRSGLAPLRRITRELAHRGADDLSPLHAPAPGEVAPVVEALNGLFRRVQAARQHEQDFTAYAAHELKTPLAGLKMQAEVARRAPDAATRDHALAQIRRAVDRSDRLVHQLLDMAAVDQGAAESPPRPLGRIGAEVLELTLPAARARDVRLTLDCAPALADRPQRDPALLVVALRNLVENAVHASAVGGRVELALRPDGAGWRAEIRDEGPGIPQEIRGRITERFYRGPAGGEGSGLGLAIVEAAARRLGAQFALRPQSPRGEVATLLFPASDLA